MNDNLTKASINYIFINYPQTQNNMQSTTTMQPTTTTMMPTTT